MATYKNIHFKERGQGDEYFKISMYSNTDDCSPSVHMSISVTEMCPLLACHIQCT